MADGSLARQAPTPLAASSFDYAFDRRDIIEGNDVALLRDGFEAFPAMIEAIDAATETVCLETYILADDVVGWKFADALSRAAKRGVRCSLLYDAVGSPLLAGEYIQTMVDAGVDVTAFRPLSARLPFRYLIRRDHRKTLVIDDRIAFVGGINVHVQAAPIAYGGHGWHDFAVRVLGPAVARLANLFDESWRIAKRRRLRRTERTALVARHVSPVAGDVAVQVVATDKVRGRWAIRRSLLYAISQARHSVLIANAYFVPDPGVVRSLTAAARRGVTVSVMVPERSDVALVDYVRGAFYDRLLRHRVRVYHWAETVLHAKVAVVDDAWAMVGSYNLDWMSLLRNREVVVNVFAPEFARLLADQLRTDLAVSLEITREGWEKRSFWRRWVFEPFLYAFRRYL